MARPIGPFNLQEQLRNRLNDAYYLDKSLRRPHEAVIIPWALRSRATLFLVDAQEGFP